MHLQLLELIAAADRNTLAFQDVMATIRSHYECLPVAFSTGIGGPAPVNNPAGTNAASCHLLAFARRLGLSEQTTLGLYGEHYRDVLASPQGNTHANIRAFMARGWAGIEFGSDPLRLRGPG